MNNDLKQLVEFSKYLDTILDETKGVLKENIEIENMYNSMLEDKNEKQFIQKVNVSIFVSTDDYVLLGFCSR